MVGWIDKKWTYLLIEVSIFPINKSFSWILLYILTHHQKLPVTSNWVEEKASDDWISCRFPFLLENTNLSGRFDKISIWVQFNIYVIICDYGGFIFSKKEKIDSLLMLLLHWQLLLILNWIRDKSRATCLQVRSKSRICYHILLQKDCWGEVVRWFLMIWIAFGVGWSVSFCPNIFWSLLKLSNRMLIERTVGLATEF